MPRGREEIPWPQMAAILLTRGADRQAKEQAMHQRFLERLEAGLRELESAMSTGHLHD